MPTTMQTGNADSGCEARWSATSHSSSGPGRRAVATRLQELVGRERRAFENVLVAGHHAGELAVSDPERTAEMIVACLHGLLLLAKVSNDLSVLPSNEAELLRVAGSSI